MLLSLHGPANVVHNLLIPGMGLVPPRIASVVEVEGIRCRSGEVPSDIVVHDIYVVLLKLDIPRVVGEREHVVKRIRRPSQVHIAIEKYEIIAVGCQV